MSLKEFDAKQFLLEKGEQVGLGVAVTLMVLMLIFNLFLPSHGFLSGSPVDKAEPLKKDSDRLQTALNTGQPADKDKPGNAKERLIGLDTSLLQPGDYATVNWFEPSAPTTSARRPPAILTLDEAVAEPAFVLVDTLMFSKNFEQLLTLQSPEGKGPAGGAGAPGGRNNSLAGMYKGQSMEGAPGGPGGAGNNADAINKLLIRFIRASKGGIIQGADDKPEYQTKWVSFGNIGSEKLARQPQPTRMVVIAGSFPYKQQLDEFRQKLNLKTTQDVFDEMVKLDDKDKDEPENSPAFRFLSVIVERREVDVSGNPVDGKAGQWTPLPLAESYKLWLLNSGLPFEEDDRKYDPVKCPGLVAPRLREFHDERPQNMMGAAGMPGFPAPGAVPGREMARQEPPSPGESNYPDVAGKVKNIQDTLSKLAEVDARKIVTIPRSQAHNNFDPFNPDAPAAAANEPAKKRTNKAKAQDEEGEVIPEHCLVRIVDVTVEAGKIYRYRFKVRMVNPNYGRDDVASAAYKKGTTLESRDWFELKEPVHMPPETTYYVVDESKVSKGEKHARNSVLDRMWKFVPRPSERYVCFQFQRWIESTPIGGTPTSIGDWAVADRVFVPRGEFVGGNVVVDLPAWKYTQDSYILPAEDQKNKRRGRVPSGVSVNFGSEDAQSGTILIDFEGGSESIRETKLTDTGAIEVLMLSPDGKLVARNSAKDANDQERKDHRARAQRRVQEVLEGKSSGANLPAAGGGLDGK